MVSGARLPGKREYLDVPCGSLYFDSGPRKLVKRLAVPLQSGGHRWNLGLLPVELPEHLVYPELIKVRHGGGLHNPTFRVTRGRPRSQRDRKAVELAAGKDIPGDLGCLPEADWEHPASEGIEAAYVPCLVGTEHAPGFLKSRVRRQPQRLIEQQNSTFRSG